MVFWRSQDDREVMNRLVLNYSADIVAEDGTMKYTGKCLAARALSNTTNGSLNAVKLSISMCFHCSVNVLGESVAYSSKGWSSLYFNDKAAY